MSYYASLSLNSLCLIDLQGVVIPAYTLIFMQFVLLIRLL